ncbi:hypothetical protein IOK37_26190 [Escherichia coli]|nr:hypothetical protein [Escherichia coli]
MELHVHLETLSIEFELQDTFDHTTGAVICLDSQIGRCQILLGESQTISDPQRANIDGGAVVNKNGRDPESSTLDGDMQGAIVVDSLDWQVLVREVHCMLRGRWEDE